MLPGPVSSDLIPILRSIPAVCAHDDGLAHLRSQLSEKANELPLGLDTKLFSPGATSVRSILGWTDQHRVIGYVGRLHPIKGIDLLSTAFHVISRKSLNVRLLVVGSGEEEKNVRSELAGELSRGIAHIEPAMDQKQLPEWYRAMDLMVMPSRYETMSNAVLEGMACGIPFLASNVGGNRTLGETGAGWVFDSGSASSLTDRLREIVGDDSQLRHRGRVGFRYVQAYHSWATSAERLERIIAEHLGVH
jgi:glycosyltransferase involved in cell wall biosynthesis